MYPSKYEIIMKLAESKSISKTAEYFHFTQPSVSQTCRSIEEEIGIMLFYRTPQGLILSDEGKQILPFIKNICDSKNRLDEEIARLHEYNTGNIKIGAYVSITCSWLPSVVCEFNDIYPNISFEFWQEDDTHLLKQLHEGVFDIALMSDPGKSNLLYEDLFEDEFVLIVPENHRLADKETISIPDLQNEKFLSIRGGFEKIIAEEFAKYDISPDIAYYFDEDSSIISMVSAGFGITLMPRLLTLNSSFNVRIKKLSWPFFRHLGIVTLKQKKLLWAHDRFIEFLKDKSEQYGGSV